MPKLSKRARFLQNHPFCCFCGGNAPATTSDHIPPRACFPDGFHPESFEFPACQGCNAASKEDDQIVGLTVLLMEWSELNGTPEHKAKVLKLWRGITENYPNALPDLSRVRPIYRVGHVITPTPAALVLPLSTEPINYLLSKLTHSLYYLEVGKPLSKSQRFQSGFYQIQGNPPDLTNYLATLLPKTAIGNRPNIKNYGQYGERFAYKAGFKEDEDFFVYAAQFGKSMIVWGMTFGPNTQFSEPAPALGPVMQAGTPDNTAATP